MKLKKFGGIILIRGACLVIDNPRIEILKFSFMYCCLEFIFREYKLGSELLKKGEKIQIKM